MRYIFSSIIGVFFSPDIEVLIWLKNAEDVFLRAAFMIRNLPAVYNDSSYWHDVIINGEVVAGIPTLTALLIRDTFTGVALPIILAAGLFFLLIHAERATQVSRIFVFSKRSARSSR